MYIYDTLCVSLYEFRDDRSALYWSWRVLPNSVFAFDGLHLSSTGTECWRIKFNGANNTAEENGARGREWRKLGNRIRITAKYAK